ncbi:MAG TPA: hypothetical protein VGL55_02035 [Steroidobacteraceae bacterium]|jgi:hypothetical protein
MTARTVIARVVRQENLNFLLTNRIPRRWLTLLIGRLIFSPIRSSARAIETVVT